MKTSTIACAMAAALISIMADAAGAQATYRATGAPWVVYRDAQGQLTRDSIQAAQKMRRKAARDGYITLWLLIDSNQAGEPAVSNDEYNRACQEILQPLVARALVSHPSGGPRNTGPVCLIRATTAGVSALLRNERVHQIMGAHDGSTNHEY